MTDTPIREARDAVFLELLRLAHADPDVLLFTVDTGAFLLKRFAAELPGRFHNLGIAEQNAVSVCAGLALAGKKPFLFGISNFVVLRCFEQLKIDVCCMNLPVTVIAMGTGYVYPKDGPTHHMTDVLSLARTLPGLHLWSPSDYAAIAGATRRAHADGGPHLIYMDKGPFDVLPVPPDDYAAGVRVLRPGTDVTLVATGIMVPQALAAAAALAAEGIRAGVVDVYRLKPLAPGCLATALGGARGILTLEENVLAGGLGALVCETVLDAGLPARVRRLGIPEDAIHCDLGTREQLRDADGFGAADILAAARRLVGETR